METYFYALLNRKICENIDQKTDYLFLKIIIIVCKDNLYERR